MYRPLAIALLGAAAFTSPLRAQMRSARATAAPPPPAANPSPGHGSLTINFGQPPRMHLFGPRTVFFPTPYFYPYDYPPEPVVTEAPPPQVVVVQAPPVAAQAPEASPEPLLLERQGDHWVRITSYGQSATRTRPDYSEESDLRSAAPGRKSPVQPIRELPPAVLVFRDGRQENVSSYTIIGKVLYTNADYWTTGSWTKKIQLADLDLPATLKLNQERGANFVLPAGPNEVVMRP